MGVSASSGSLNTEKHSEARKVNNPRKTNNNKTYLIATSCHFVASTKTGLYGLFLQQITRVQLWFALNIIRLDLRHQLVAVNFKGIIFI